MSLDTSSCGKASICVVQLEVFSSLFVKKTPRALESNTTEAGKGSWSRSAPSGSLSNGHLKATVTKPLAPGAAESMHPTRGKAHTVPNLKRGIPLTCQVFFVQLH